MAKRQTAEFHLTARCARIFALQLYTTTGYCCCCRSCCCCGRVLHTFRSRRSHFRRCHFHSIYLLRLWLLVFLSIFRICSGSFVYCISIIFSYSFNIFFMDFASLFYEPKRKRTTSQQKEQKKNTNGTHFTCNFTQWPLFRPTIRFGQRKRRKKKKYQKQKQNE